MVYFINATIVLLFIFRLVNWRTLDRLGILGSTQWMAGIALSLYLVQQVSLPFQEEWVLEYLVITSFFLGLMEVIHIDLSDE